MGRSPCCSSAGPELRSSTLICCRKPGSPQGRREKLWGLPAAQPSEQEESRLIERRFQENSAEGEIKATPTHVHTRRDSLPPRED